MKMLYENKVTKVQIALFPKQKRTILLEGRTKFIEIPEHYAVCYYGYCGIERGFIVDAQLKYYLSFGSNGCLNGYSPRNMQEYIDWYWSSKFSGGLCAKIFASNLCKKNWFGEPLHFLFVKNNKNIISFKYHQNDCEFCLGYRLSFQDFVEV